MDQLLQKIPVTPGVQSLIGIGIIIIVTILAAAILRLVVFSVIGRLTRKTSTTLDDHLLKATRAPLRFLVYVFGLSVLFNYITARYPEYVTEGISRVIDGIIYGLGVIVVAVLLIKVVSSILQWYGDTIAAKTETNLDNEFVPLLDRSFKIVLVILAALVVFDHFGVDIKGMLAVLGVGSLAVALAAQETLANMIGGFTIMIDRPFRVGDMVRLAEDRRVIVHEIGIRSTKFLTFDNTLVVVPNAELIKSTVHNITYPLPRVRVVIDVGVSYSSNLDRVREIMFEEADKDPLVLKEPKPLFFFLNFGESSLEVSLRCHVGQPLDHQRVSSQLRERILERFRSEGIEIPFPQRVVTIVGSGKEGKTA